MTHDTEWYYNLVTGQVEQYEGGRAEDRLGPYLFGFESFMEIVYVLVLI